MNEDTIAEIKAAVEEAIDKLQPKLIDLAERIHRHPEIKFEEYKASQWLSEAAEAAGFRVEKPIGGLETAFRASYSGSEAGPTVAFLAEYDALPKLGHACGHNLIGTASLGAAMLGGLGCGLFATLEEARTHLVTAETMQEPDPQRVGIYAEGYERYCQLEAHLLRATATRGPVPPDPCAPPAGSSFPS